MTTPPTSLSLEETMEEAVKNLQHTVCLAQLCARKPTKHSRELLSHARALEEDLAALTITRTTTPETVELAKKAKNAALQLKRTIEREALALHVAESEAASSSAQASADESSTSTTEHPHQVKLHPLKVPVFTGEPSHFKLFFDIFNENVENNSKLTDGAKWVYLDESVKGQAVELIAKIPRYPGMRQIALETLETRYGNPARTVCDLYQQLQSLPPATLDEDKLRLTQAQIEGLLLSLEALNHQVNHNEFLLSVVKGKFPIDFLHLVIPTPDADNLKQIRLNLQNVIAARERVVSTIVHTTPRNKSATISTSASSESSTRNNRNPRTTVQRTPKCMFCAGPHWSDEYTLYPSITARQQRIPDRCFTCFRLKHNGPCLTEKCCAHCDDPSHNRAMCPKKFPKDTVLYARSNSNSTPQPIINPSKDGVYLTLLLSVSSPTQQTPQTIRAVLDSGGAKSILTTDAARLLQVTKLGSPDLPLSGLGNADLPGITPAAQNIYLHAENEKIELPIHLTPVIADDLPAAHIDSFREQYPEYATVNIPPPSNGQKIDLLLGKDALAAVCVLNESIYVSPDHQLLGTKFGHLIMGTRITVSATKDAPHLYFNAPPPDDLRNMWQLDTLGLQELESKDSEQKEATIQTFYNTIEFVNGRYQLGWPFKIFPPLLSPNYGLALGRLKSIWNCLCQNKDLLLAYHQIIMDQLSNCVIEIVKEKSIQNHQILHYIPHHPIIRHNKSTKIRIVYDGSAKATKTSKSLNENLYAGGNWVKDLFIILIRLRIHQTVISADIEKAFLQIQIRPQDRDATRFLWLHDPLLRPTSSNLRHYRFCRMAFGIVCSPFLLAATIQHHLKNHPHEFNELIRDHLYADNLVLSLPNEIDPIEFYQQVKLIFAEMGMNMSQWLTNAEQLRKQLPPNDAVNNVQQSILGLIWNSSTDTLQIKTPNFSSPTDHILTKRLALQQMAAVFDPLGMATPILLCAKIFIRKLWEASKDWDEHLIREKQKEWQLILSELRQIHRVSISRQMFPLAPSNVTKLQLHIFADASADAYASVIYARAITQHTSHISFVASKSRLSPKKQLTIPRLELLAILIGCCFATFIAKNMQWPTPPELILWSDSTCALAWIDNKKILPVVIQKQIQEIQTYNINSFRHVASVNNYADVASRGASYDQLHELHWWDGPGWLKNENSWPPTTTTNLETSNHIDKETHLLFTRTKTIEQIPPEKIRGIFSLNYTTFSSMRQLLLRVAHVCTALNRLLKTEFIKTEQHPDIQLAEFLLIRYEQHQVYAHVFESTRPPTSLRNIRIFIDDHQLIRYHTPLQHTSLTADTISPILLIKGSELTRLIIMEAHEQTGHAGTSHTLAHIRQKFWLPQGRREIFKVVRKHCYRNRRFTAQPFSNPTTPLLPEFKVTQTDRPFEAVGMDVFGPYQVRHNNATNQSTLKHWVLLTTCAVTRAIHLEILTDMSTAALIDALRRFIARRGAPKIIVADNAPQFTKLNQQLHDTWTTLPVAPQAVAYFAENRIQWKFLPPESPWMGGFYERLVGTVKIAFDKTYSIKTLTQRQFETLMIEIEGIINSRPLTYVDNQPDSTIITPLDFLRIKYPALPLDNDNADDNNRILHLWRASQRHIDEFWSHWSTQYLLHLRERDDKLKRKNNNQSTSPAVGDLVLLTEPEKKHNAWQLAVIETLIRINDGQIRSALVHLGQNRRLIRPIIKLAPLGLTNQTVADNPVELTEDREYMVVDNHPNPPESLHDDDQVIEIELDDDW